MLLWAEETLLVLPMLGIGFYVGERLMGLVRMESLTGSYSSLYFGGAGNNALTYLLTSTLCHLISGVAILVVGVIITSVTFQNLDPVTEGNKQRYAGPILMGAGILVLGRSAFHRLRNQDFRGFWNRQRVLFRRFCYRRHTDDSEETAIYLEPTDEDFWYVDDPPPYETVANSPCASIPPVSSSSPISVPVPMSSGHLPLSTAATTLSALSPTYQPNAFGAIVNPALETDEDGDLSMPPPPYEQVCHITQTRL